jgi:hypothetical protein
VYGILFRTTADTLRTIAADPRHLGATIGVFAVRHTWGQPRRPQPPLHCVVPGGGLSLEGTPGLACRPGFFLPVRVWSRLFRRRVLDAWPEAFDAGQRHFAGSRQGLSEPSDFAAHLQPTRQTAWVVYAQRPFAGPPQVLEYVGRSTHRVAIAHQRLLDRDAGHVRFHDKHSRAEAGPAPQTMTREAPAFLRRLLLPVLPRGFHRIRDYGWLGPRHRTETLARCRRRLGTTTAAPSTGAPGPPADYRDRDESLTGVSLRRCPACADGHMTVTLSWWRGCAAPVARPDTSCPARLRLARGGSGCACGVSGRGCLPPPHTTRTPRARHLDVLRVAPRRATIARPRARGSPRGAASPVLLDPRLDSSPRARHPGRGFVPRVCRPPSRRSPPRHLSTSPRRVARLKTLCLPLTGRQPH